MPKQTFFNLAPEKRERILDIAIDEFAENSYKNASISRIVARAGIAKGSFYQYFEDKRDLYFYLLQLAGEQKSAYFNTFPEPEESMGTFDYLRWAFGIRIQFEVANPRLNKIGYKSLLEDADVLGKVIEQGKAQAAQFTEQLLARGAAYGDLRPDLNVELAAFIFNSVFLHLGEYLIEKLDIDPETLIQDEPFLFESAEADAIFNGIMDILEEGMGND